MVELAIEQELPFTRRRMILDLREIERSGPTYTVDTLRELRTSLGTDVPLVLIMGADQFARFDTWREWEAIPISDTRGSGKTVRRRACTE